MKQKSHSPELISRPLVTRASQENDGAKFKKNIEETKENLKKLAEGYIHVYNPKGFITDLKIALVMDPKNASGYAVFNIDDNLMRVSIRCIFHLKKQNIKEKGFCNSLCYRYSQNPSVPGTGPLALRLLGCIYL
ncbi:MAG: hypothetical protein IKZ52_01655 [Bacteroidales bacterium]|nr:hypothetical protein [Bacteroidales bacterium]